MNAPRRDPEQICCCAKPLPNPFRGVINVVRYQALDVQTIDVRYGSWNQLNGLKRGPVIPSEEFRRLERMGPVVYERLLEGGGIYRSCLWTTSNSGCATNTTSRSLDLNSEA